MKAKRVVPALLFCIVGCWSMGGCQQPVRSTSLAPTAVSQGEHWWRRGQNADLRIVTFNVNFDHIFPDKDAHQAAKFKRLVRSLNPDVLALQEIRRDADQVTQLMNDIAPLPSGASWYASKGYTNVIVSKFPLFMTADQLQPPGQRKLAMALVDLPDQRFDCDLYVINNHYKCCGDEANDPKRQKQSDAIASWLADAKNQGGQIDLPFGTAIVVLGDLNLVGGEGPLQTLLTGRIENTDVYGAGEPPDWDLTGLADAHPKHNGSGSDDYTWRNDDSEYDPGRLDFIIYSDSVMSMKGCFVLNTTLMSPEQLESSGLEVNDVTLDQRGRRFDHLPVVADFELSPVMTN